MAEAEAEKPKLKPASENPWYLLATVHGEQPTMGGFDDELHEKNRKTWNAWMSQFVTDEDRQHLRDANWPYVDELKEPTDEDRTELVSRFEALDMDLLQRGYAVELTNIEFPKNLCFSGFLFQGYALFLEATFQGTADFLEAAFLGAANFREATFQGTANFREAAFLGDAYFSEAAFRGYTSFSEAAFLGNADFSEAALQGNVYFSGAAFQAEADFNEAAFLGNASFSEAAFQGDASFREAAFQSDGSFREAAFQGDANFSKAAFQGGASFRGAAFQGDASFHEAAFQGDADFSKTAFQGDASFHGAAFQGDADFSEAAFQDRANFREASFQGDAYFSEAAFQAEADFSGAAFLGNADFRGASKSEGDARIAQNREFSGVCSFVGVQFRAGVDFTNRAFLNSTFFNRCRFYSQAPKFGGADLHQDTTWHGVEWAKVPDNTDAARQQANAYKRLRLEMNGLQDHDQELEFLALELMAKRGADGGAKGVLITLYQLSCDFGRSVSVPVYWLVGLWYCCALVYRLFEPGMISGTKALGFSLASMGGLFGMRREFFGPLMGSLPDGLLVLSGVQSVLGAVFVFLLGLCLRNRFRIR